MLDPDEEDAARAYIEVTDSPSARRRLERARYREAHNRGLAFIECPGEDLNAPAGAPLGALLTKIVRKHRLLRPRQPMARARRCCPEFALIALIALMLPGADNRRPSRRHAIAKHSLAKKAAPTLGEWGRLPRT